jgi:hypothetical protein
MGSANDGLRFLLELAVLAAPAVWGTGAVSGPLRWALAVGAPPERMVEGALTV